MGCRTTFCLERVQVRSDLGVERPKRAKTMDLLVRMHSHSNPVGSFLAIDDSPYRDQGYPTRIYYARITESEQKRVE